MPENQTFKNTREVAAWLIEQGWQVSQASVYNHAHKGLLGKKKDGVYTLAQVKKYAAANLMTGGGVQTKKQEELNESRIKAEISLKTAQAKREQLKLAEEEERLISREEADIKAAASAIALYSEIMGAFEAGAVEMVGLAGGDEKNAGLVLGYLKDILDGAMNEYASGKVYKIETGDLAIQKNGAISEGGGQD